ncbi:hypothetical protein QRX60_17260 [Amycolatopsis mongoliensis]|uniref:Uncharacterized protein n=1 Tax=Amycolatopsis mongoliensis TaxID=715475 RepID=A0A9Y2NHQ3_9PSEU|nr:hypothetical protein [Amycolatopsis sp. 4-36]WIY05507.1 hypothetical protein QRX60_17260 [Amycolatopsis sp. 4-36]
MLLARAWHISAGEVVRRLLDNFVKQHIEATFNPDTKRVAITTGELAGRSYKSPSGAAIGVVQALNPHVCR